jgi:hypothetical protein
MPITLCKRSRNICSVVRLTTEEQVGPKGDYTRVWRVCISPQLNLDVLLPSQADFGECLDSRGTKTTHAFVAMEPASNLGWGFAIAKQCAQSASIFDGLVCTLGAEREHLECVPSALRRQINFPRKFIWRPKCELTGCAESPTRTIFPRCHVGSGS